MSWIKKLFGGKKAPSPEGDDTFEMGDLVLMPSAQSTQRAEEAMPGTADLTQIFKLTPPPLDPDLISYGRADEETRDYGPDPVAEISARFVAKSAFDCKKMGELLYGDFSKTVLQPTYYVKTTQGQITYMTSADAPEKGVELIVGWSMHDLDGKSPASILKAHKALVQRLANSETGFEPAPFGAGEIQAKIDVAKTIHSLKPDAVTIIAYNENDAPFDGRQIWNLLHQMGFTWGDMDCFQWRDETGQTDYLIWVEAEDNVLGYVLPEEVAAGRQHFYSVRFQLSVLRTPHPEHVLDEMIKASNVFAQMMGCQLAAMIDEDHADTPEDLIEAVKGAVADLQKLGLKAGSDAVCQLR